MRPTETLFFLKLVVPTKATIRPRFINVSKLRVSIVSFLVKNWRLIYLFDETFNLKELST